MRVGVKPFAEGTLDRTHVSEITKRAGVLRMLFYHYLPSKMVFARTIVEYEILHLHGLAEQQTTLTLEGAVFTFTGYVKARPNSLRALHTGGLGQNPETAAALATSFERYERLVLMLMGVPEPNTRIMSAAHAWISTMISLCLAWLGHLEVNQEIITNIPIQTLRDLVSQARQGVGHTSEPAATPVIAPESVSNR